MSERPAALDGLLNHIAANIPDLPDEEAATAKARAAIAPLEKAIRAAKAQEHAEIRTAALLEGADVVFALTFDECGRADTEFVSFQHAWDLGTLDATHRLRRLAKARTGEQPTEAAAQEERDEQQAQAHLDQLANELPNPAAPGDIDRTPVAKSIVYVVRGVPDVPDEYNETRTIAPREIMLTYRATTDSGLGRIHAYIKGWWMQDGARVASESVGRHFHGDLAEWPDWLAAEARLHDPDPS